MERFRRGLKKDETNNLPASFSDPSNNSLQSIFDEELPPVPPPTGIDMGQWEAFYVEFGELLSKACYLQPCVNEEKEDDSALLWSTDRGAGELLQRRERRAQRATDALAVAHAGYEVLDKKVDETFRTHGDANNAGKDTENNSMKWDIVWENFRYCSWKLCPIKLNWFTLTLVNYSAWSTSIQSSSVIFRHRY